MFEQLFQLNSIHSLNEYGRRLQALQNVRLFAAKKPIQAAAWMGWEEVLFK